MGLLSHDWAYIQNLYLQSLGAKVTGHIWIYSLIRILWDTNWDICNYMNHNLHAKDGPTEIDILACINTIITYHPLRGMTGLPQIWHLLFTTNAHTLFPHPVRQRLSWIVATSNTCRCSQQKPNKSTYLLDIYQTPLDRITNVRLIPSLSKFEQITHFFTTRDPDQSRTLFIEQEYYPI